MRDTAIVVVVIVVALSFFLLFVFLFVFVFVLVLVLVFVLHSAYTFVFRIRMQARALLHHLHLSCFSSPPLLFIPFSSLLLALLEFIILLFYASFFHSFFGWHGVRPERKKRNLASLRSSDVGAPPLAPQFQCCASGGGVYRCEKNATFASIK